MVKARVSALPERAWRAGVGRSARREEGGRRASFEKEDQSAEENDGRIED